MNPQDAQRLLRERADALGLPLSASQGEQLWQYLQLLGHWNRVYNLTAIRQEEDMIHQHLVDSLAAVPALRRWAAHRSNDGADAPSILDVGSGGGLPGVVWSVLQPQWPVVCIDAVAKKTTFVRQVAGELKLKHLEACHARVERWPGPQGAKKFDLIASRAFAALADFVTWTQHLLAPGGVWLALKGRQPDEELAAVPAAVEVFHVEPLQVPGLDAQRCLVWMRKKSVEEMPCVQSIGS